MAVAWDTDMDKVLRQGLARRQSLSSIAEQIGVAHGTASTRADLLGIPRPRRQPSRSKVKGPPRNAMEMQFADLLAEGFSPKEAGERVGAANGNAMLQRIRSKLGPQAV